MKASRRDPFILTAAAAALLLAFGPARAQDNSVAQLSEPQSSINVGVGYVDKDNHRFGQYNGLIDKGSYGIVDFNIDKRDDKTGTWLRLQGRDLGYKDPELRLEQKRQGDWGYYIDYDRIPRYEPYTVNTGLQGVGTTTQTTVPITAGTGTNYQLDTKRDRWTFGLQKALRGWDVAARYRTEDKDGTQLYGTGHFAVSPRFLTKPIDYTMQQIDLTADYNTESYQLRLGYYGSFFDDKNTKITVTNPASSSVFSEYGTPPDNQSHQFYVSGGYNFTDTTRGDFKVSYARATQDDPWGIAPPPGVTATSLDGRVDTTLVQAGVSGRATPKLTWRADFRYQNRDDKTPQVVNSSLESYQPHSLERTTGKVIGNYSLPMGFRLSGEITFDQKKREVPEDTVVQFREKVNETTYKVTLRRAVSSTVTGALSLLHSKRDGSDWLFGFAGLGGNNLIAPLNLADRDRNTARMTVNWMASDALSLNFRADGSKDDYKSLPNIYGLDLGPREGKASNYSVDASYVFSDSVNGTAWYSHGKNEMEEATCNEYPTAGQCTLSGSQARPIFAANVRNTSDNFGLGLQGKVSSRIDVGANVTQAKVTDDFGLNVLVQTTPTTPVTQLDSIETKVTTVGLYARYALDRKSGVRLDYTYDQYQTDDWTWSRWVYSDGTTVLQDPNQKVNFVGVSYYYKFY